MKVKIHAYALYTWILRFTQLQLFITVVSLPILIAWGLPLSLLSPIGNLIFSPVLACFLFLACLIFFCEILFIPNAWLIYSLESITSWWHALLNIPDKRWLIGFKEPSMFILMVIPCLAFFIILNKHTREPHRSIVCFTEILAAIALYAHVLQPANNYWPISCNNGTIPIIQSNNKITVIDPGFIGQRTSATSWVQYSLVPHLIKQSSKNTIDHLILLKPGTFLFEAIEQLCRCATIKNIYLVYWQGTMKKSGLHAYGDLKKMITSQQIKLIRIGNKPITIADDSSVTLTITPLKTILSASTITYNACRIDTQIDNSDITLYSAQYTSKEPACSTA